MNGERGYVGIGEGSHTSRMAGNSGRVKTRHRSQVLSHSIDTMPLCHYARLMRSRLDLGGVIVGNDLVIVEGLEGFLRFSIDAGLDPSLLAYILSDSRPNH